MKPILRNLDYFVCPSFLVYHARNSKCKIYDSILYCHIELLNLVMKLSVRSPMLIRLPIVQTKYRLSKTRLTSETKYQSGYGTSYKRINDSEIHQDWSDINKFPL